MKRRTFSLGALGTALLGLLGWPAQSAAGDYKRAAEDYRAKALANFPFQVIETTGANALAKWQELKVAGRGTPVVVGSQEAFDNLLTPFGPNGPLVPSPPSVESILKAAAALHFPDDLVALKAREDEEARRSLRELHDRTPDAPVPTIIESDGQGHSRTLSKEEAWQQFLAEPTEPELGAWPDRPEPSVGLSVATDILKGTPLDKVIIVVVPTDDPTAVPAYLRWGGWNACPAAEHHVAALRSWRDRYGAELIGLGFDTMNLRVARRPQSRDEAIVLAREQYAYCNDIVEQGFGTFSALAAALMEDDWWYLWWD